jgi:hypothetical protein
MNSIDVTNLKNNMQTTKFLNGINTTHPIKNGKKPNPGTLWSLETYSRQRMGSEKHNTGVA